MTRTGRRSRGWTAALFAGAIYAGLGLAASALSGASAGHPHTLIARWSAFAISGVVYLTHVAWEALARLRTVSGTAWRVALGAAVGGLLLAAATNLHELRSGEPFRPQLLAALAIWPLLTSVPALLGALVLAAILSRLQPRPTDER